MGLPVQKSPFWALMVMTLGPRSSKAVMSTA